MDTKKQQKRKAILASARTVFAAKGFENSSIRDIARGAGVADGTIYNYFAHKQDLLQALITDLVDTLGKAESRSLNLANQIGFEERVMHRMHTLQSAYHDLAAVLPVILSDADLRQHFQKHFVEPVLVNLESELGATHGSLLARILLSSVLGFQMLLLLGDPLTIDAWNNPDELAKVWTKFILNTKDQAKELP